MNRKLSWFIGSILTMVALIVASCTSPPTTPTTETEASTDKPTTAPTVTAPTVTTPTVAEIQPTQPVTALSPETPKYGGVFTGVQIADPVRGFDQYWAKDGVQNYYHDTLVTGDWAKGPAGTNQVTWNRSGFPIVAYFTGALAESWDLPDAKTIVFHIRKGVHFALDPDSEASRLVNGREFVAEDVIKSWERYYSNPASVLSNTVRRAGIVEMYAPDKYTVVVIFNPNPARGEEFLSMRGWAMQYYTFMTYEAPEVAKKYGDTRDWRNAVGEGPFILKDYVSGSMLTFQRNPNYYMFDPLHPENRLPYIETVRVAIIPDLSARLAALRTGKLDQVQDVPWEQGLDLIKTNPELGYSKYLSSDAGSWVVAFRSDKPEQPWYKQEVRQALTMAIDYEGLKNGYYGGNAIYPAWPVAPFPEFQDIGFYVPLKELPADIQELFSYNPTKAKQMLADAGYPNGFKASVILQTKDTDMAEMFKAYWAAIGVDLELQIKEPAVWSSISTSKTQPELIFWATAGIYATNLINYIPGNFNNFAVYTGPEISAKALELDELWFDPVAMGKVYREFQPHLYRLALYVGTPMGYAYNFGQPWVQNYHGEWSVGNIVNGLFVKYIWVDMELKKAMLK